MEPDCEMELKSSKRLANGRCVPAEATVARLEEALGRLGPLEYSESRMSDHLYSGSLQIALALNSG